MLPFLYTEQYQAQQSKEEKQLVLALLADTEGMLVYNAACVLCLSVYPGMKGPIANLALRNALEHPCQPGARGKEHAVKHLV